MEDRNDAIKRHWAKPNTSEPWGMVSSPSFYHVANLESYACCENFAYFKFFRKNVCGVCGEMFELAQATGVGKFGRSFEQA
jgi:hypothetical protein